jgi:phosphatidylglycerol:prolipoprotein diacylglycerol transferase
MHPYLLHHPLVPAFGFMMSLALVVAWWVSRVTARSVNLEPSHIDLMTPLVVGTGMLGAWLSTKLMPDASRVLYWALLPAVAAGIIYCAFNRLPLGRIGDSIAGGMALAIAIGRIGCYLAGCCFGDFCPEPLGVRFPHGSFAWQAHLQERLIEPSAPLSLAVHPTQLYESVLIAGLAIVIGATFNRRRVWGESFILFAGGYAVIRFLIEFVRADESPTWMDLRLSQWISLFVVAVIAVMFIIRRRYADVLQLRIKRRPLHA